MLSEFRWKKKHHLTDQPEERTTGLDAAQPSTECSWLLRGRFAGAGRRCADVDTRKWMCGALAFRPVGEKFVAFLFVEDVVDIIIAPRVYRKILINIRPTPIHQQRRMMIERTEAFFRRRIAPEVGVEKFQGFGVKI